MSDGTSLNELTLSSRAATILNNAGAYTVGDARMLVKDRKLQRIRNCGPVTMDEIMKAVGLTPSGTRRTVTIHCPHCSRRVRVAVSVEPLGYGSRKEKNT